MSECQETELGLLPSSWKVLPLEEVCAKVSVGFVGTTSPFFTDNTDGIPLIRSQNVRPGFLDLQNNLKYVTPEFHFKNRKSAIQSGDLLIVRVGENRGDCCVVPDVEGELNAANVVFARPRSDLSDFLGFFFRCRFGQQLLSSRSTGSAQEVINTKEISKLLVPIPPQNEVNEIVRTLKVLDRKIENLRRQNETLERIAQTLFKHWFVNFEFPNEDGKPYKSSGGEMVRSDLGEIPEGWQVRKFGELGELNRGKSKHRPRYAEHLYGGMYPFIQTGDVKESQGFITEYQQTYSEDGLAQSRLWYEETLCITIAANIAETGILTFPACFPDSVIGFIADPEVCDVYLIHRMFNFKRQEIESTAIGSVQKNLNLRTIENIILCIPPLEKYKDLIGLIRKLGKRIENNKEQIRTLTQTRDVLLPKLMSGKLRITE